MGALLVSGHRTGNTDKYGERGVGKASGSECHAGSKEPATKIRLDQQPGQTQVSYVRVGQERWMANQPLRRDRSLQTCTAAARSTQCVAVWLTRSPSQRREREQTNTPV